MLGQASGLFDIPSVIIVTRTMRNEQLEAIFSRLRAITGHRIIPRRFAAAKLLKALKRGESTALADRSTRRCAWAASGVGFSGVPVLASPAIAQLALHSGASIMLHRPLSDAAGPDAAGVGPEIVYVPTGNKDADIQGITQQCLDFCESVIRQQPEYWLWSYKRWKTRPDGRNKGGIHSTRVASSPCQGAPHPPPKLASEIPDETGPKRDAAPEQGPEHFQSLHQRQGAEENINLSITP